MKKKSNNRQKYFSKRNFRRLSLVVGMFFAAFLLVIIRLFYVMIIKSRYYNDKAVDNWERERSIKAERGCIYDRNGVLLAGNKAVCSISVIHSQIEDEEAVIATLTEKLNLDEAYVRKQVEKVSVREKIKSNVDKTVADEIRNLDLSGVKVDEDYKRYYPYDELASKVLGFTGGDNQGIIGLEVKYDDILMGESGSINTVTNGRGIELAEMPETRIDPVPGDNLITTLDINIQQYIEEKAMEVKERKNAKRVCIIVMNPQNGELYGMADVPEYNLNKPFEIEGTDAKSTEEEDKTDKKNNMDELNNMWRSFPVNDTYEPGSTFKTVTATAAFEAGLLNINDTFSCPGFRIVEDRRIKCHKTTGHGMETFREGIMNSCNPVFMDVAARVGVDGYYKNLQKLGLFEKTGIDLPGEATSIFHKKENVGPVELATMSFGQSFQITPLQLMRAVSAIINGGTLVTPHIGKYISDTNGNLIERLEYPEKENVISSETSETMRELLYDVVTYGTGKNAFVEGFDIGGKTATSEKLPRRTGKYISSFIGFAPADNPQVLTLILIDEPEGVYYGGTIAAPVVGDIYKNILPYLGIDKKETNEDADTETISIYDTVF